MSKKEIRRKQVSIYLNEEEKILLKKLAKRIGKNPSQIMREALIIFSTHPELEVFLDQKVLFKLDPNEVDLIQKLLPEITKLVKSINQISKDDNNEKTQE